MIHPIARAIAELAEAGFVFNLEGETIRYQLRDGAQVNAPARARQLLAFVGNHKPAARRFLAFVEERRQLRATLASLPDAIRLEDLHDYGYRLRPDQWRRFFSLS